MTIILAPFILMALADASNASPKKSGRITIEKAQKVAMEKVPGTIKSSEFEHEMGQDVYSFDIIGNDKAIHEVLVSAKSGKIVSSKIESAQQEQKEAIEDQKKK